ncbi:hypothetical protein ARMGADRAFT_1087343 [Armillaria gallica]|uniref:DUF6535 domain-containing protein n=1 Tax=Armillaria gallica TaxID=47427 RepID=A0A2H3CQX9_ARMGA|nr:hypothetical protein ARMGADRAFT_1087343 [Armillaria gallica]
MWPAPVPKSRLWEYYTYEARVADKDMLRRWQDDMATLLIFVGLFSGGVLTVFLIETEKISIRPATAGAPMYKMTDALSEFLVPRKEKAITMLIPSAILAPSAVLTLKPPRLNVPASVQWMLNPLLLPVPHLGRTSHAAPYSSAAS